MDKPHLLIVEDDLHLLEGVQSVLEIEGYDITTAENGAVALKLLNDEVVMPDLIVSDIMMPHMDGLTFLREVRKSPAYVSIPFIFLTAKGERRDVNEGKKLGVDDYIIKPFDTDDLLIAIESRLKRHEALNSAQAGVITNVKRNILNVLNHEFRTPLTYIVAYADMLNQPDATSLSGDELLGFLHGVNSGALRLRRLVENFIQLVELETGEAERTFNLRRTSVEHVQEIFNAAITSIKQQFPERPVNPFTFALADNLPRFTGDTEFLRVAFAHLIDNAMKFSSPDKAITLSAQVKENELHLSVEDAGRGITPVEQERIWDMFYQVNRAYYEDQGVGAGLPIVRGIAQLHGGRVLLASELGKGSTFTVVLPL
ncbi:MAG: response regulator [Chloroflexota bacterium]|nr:response regulator [Chloroflexota bacterium]